MHKALHLSVSVGVLWWQLSKTITDAAPNSATNVHRRGVNMFQRRLYSQHLQQRYHLASPIAIACPLGSLRVSSVAECRAAAVMLGSTYGSIGMGRRTRGAPLRCFWTGSVASHHGRLRGPAARYTEICKASQSPTRPSLSDLELLQAACRGERPLNVVDALKRVEAAHAVALEMGAAPRVPLETVDGRFQVVYAEDRGWLDDQQPHLITMDFQDKQMRLSSPLFSDKETNVLVRQLWQILHRPLIGKQLKYDERGCTLSWNVADGDASMWRISSGTTTTWRIFYAGEGFLAVKSSDTGYNLVRRLGPVV
eukprot:gnl/TRDRNA2_/TRDRNA2_91302_c0_seq1.p1 gnl/TRDRNA2_/TRDRNA2_91302_c0~~gnl/TRDRNA2_/TRDRNA2_91302_c0_seq1.p1  ORF type:complete len:310 (+),score=23.77 gnl/TRDRNA2_/TRDRNA2_91302_c0_seq1:88-1017(+)